MNLRGGPLKADKIDQLQGEQNDNGTRPSLLTIRHKPHPKKHKRRVGSNQQKGKRKKMRKILSCLLDFFFVREQEEEERG